MTKHTEDLYGLLEDSQLIQQRMMKRTQYMLKELTERSIHRGSVPKYIHALVEREYNRVRGEK